MIQADKTKQVLELCAYLLILSRGMLFVISLYCRKNYHLDKAMKVLFYVTLIGFVIAIGEILFIYLVKHYTTFFLPYLQKYEIDDTFFISPFYYLNEILFYGLAYSYSLGNKYTRPIQIVTFVLFIAEIINTIWLEGYKDSQPVGSFIFSSYNIALSFFYLKNFYAKNLRSNSTKDGILIISWGILLQSVLSIFIYILSKNIFNDDVILYYKISIFRMVIESLCFVVMAYGVWLSRNRGLKVST
ncbi:hypothetical protein LV89_04441 [Arcicella aurantiaca]|uniref:Uncharacterized protein n=1 Tax=Arcicella aurantiaca TaxID=591202 RepID=A0A316E367_9BACT|nr:hypothetical protein [Arcicella aurantiaca]PWK17340.1 hypothetical protein LV89_04441 [Arcicella aurantiaca]